jgi:hypothetical protein
MIAFLSSRESLPIEYQAQLYAASSDCRSGPSAPAGAP